MVFEELICEVASHPGGPVQILLLSYTEAFLEVRAGQPVFTLVVLAGRALLEGVQAGAGMRQNARLQTRVFEVASVVTL